MKPEHERIRALVVDTISLLCRNGLSFENELRVQAVVGVTIDKDECFVVHINKCFERKPEEEESCESEQQLKESLQQLAMKSDVPSVVSQPSREAPPSQAGGSQLSMKKPSHSQADTRSASAAGSKQQVATRDNTTSMSELHVVKSSSSKQQKSLDDCSVPPESDECEDFSLEMSNSQMHRSRQPKRQKPRRSADAYRPKPKRRDSCEEFTDVDEDDDFCAQFATGQQYMYVDSGARPKAPTLRQQKQDPMFDPCSTPSMMGYGAQSVRPFCYLKQVRKLRKKIPNLC